MVVDSSDVVAIIFKEPEKALFRRIIAEEAEVVMSAANWFEASIRIDNSGNPQDRDAFDGEVDLLDIQIMPVTADQAALARRAYQAYGRGNHPAGLNFGDCFAYALAKSTSRPLLFKGDDFSKTDILPAQPSR